MSFVEAPPEPPEDDPTSPRTTTSSPSSNYSNTMSRTSSTSRSPRPVGISRTTAIKSLQRPPSAHLNTAQSQPVLSTSPTSSFTAQSTSQTHLNYANNNNSDYHSTTSSSVGQYNNPNSSGAGSHLLSANDRGASLAMSNYKGTRMSREDDAADGPAYRDFNRSLSLKNTNNDGGAINVTMFHYDDDEQDGAPAVRSLSPQSSLNDGDELDDEINFNPPPEPEEDDDDAHQETGAPIARSKSATRVRRRRTRDRLDDVFRGSSPVPSPRNHTALVPSSSSSPAYRLATEYYEIAQLGNGAVARQWIAQGAQLRPTERAWQLLSSARDLASAAECGVTVLRLLDRYFRDKPGPFHYKGQTPSHEWDMNSPVAQGLPAKLLARLCLEVCQVLEREAPLVRPAEPCYVLGDLHGNYRDLQIFARSFWPLGIDFTPVNALFLGDYVDRGPHSIEVAAYVLALKLIAPQKVFLLRGNHEIAVLNGNEKAYGIGCFRGQCKQQYGEKRGEKVWNAFNEAFRFLPVSAVIGERVFCVHGGIPRSVTPALRNPNGNVLEIFTSLPIHTLQSWTNPTIMDMMWADPATQQEEESGLRGQSMGDNELDQFPDGFAPNKSRGPFTCVFGRDIVDLFLQKTGCSHIIRAHQPPRLGVDLRHNAKVITVFSSSHYCGAHNAAAAALVANKSIRIVLASVDQNTLMADDNSHH